jgi:hypothetical protein
MKSKIKESQIQSVIENYLKLLENIGKLVYTKNNSGALKTERGSFMRFGKSGSPDFFIFLNDNKTLHIEVKAEKGVQSPNQKDYQIKVEKLGHKYFIVRSLNDVKKLL